MSTTIEEVQLVNIISISQLKLQRNFAIIVGKLSNHDNLHQQHTINLTNLSKQIKTLLKGNQQQTNNKHKDIYKKIDQIYQQINILNNHQKSTDLDLNQQKNKIEQLNSNLDNHRFQNQQSFNVLKQQTKINQNKIKMLEIDSLKISQQLCTKQSKIQVQKLIKQADILKQKNLLIDGDLRLAEHKIQKIQILNEKNQRLQGKRQVQLLKDIDQKIKKQINNILKLNNNNNNSGTNKSKIYSNSNNYQLNLYKADSFQGIANQQNNQPRKALSFTMEQQDSNLRQLVKNNVQYPLSKLKQQIKNLQNSNKVMQQNLKLIKQQLSKEKNSPDGIKDKINQLKPQIVKLWAKFDTLEDRIGYSQKKMEEKGKLISQLLSQQKENNWNKMEQKVKTIQTQFYATIKQLKAKIDLKVNILDYDKYVLTTQEKLKQIMELIYLKSDKLEVKKALLFLESKIKEIILVISQDEQNQKDALLTKKQIKCISCDKEIQKFSGTASNQKGNWDSMPWKDHPPQILGRFGMTNYGSLSKKLKKLENQDLPILKKKAQNQSCIASNSP